MIHACYDGSFQRRKKLQNLLTRVMYFFFACRFPHIPKKSKKVIYCLDKTNPQYKITVYYANNFFLCTVRIQITLYRNYSWASDIREKVSVLFCFVLFFVCFVFIYFMCVVLFHLSWIPRSESGRYVFTAKHCLHVTVNLPHLSGR